MDKELTIVIPAFNEEKSIEQSIITCSRTNPEADILVVDDCSDDNTAEKVSGLRARIKNLRIISHSENRGYGGALITGFSNAQSEYIAFLDADLTYHPRYIPSLMKIIKEKSLDCAWGNRFNAVQNRMPLIRKIGNKFLVYLFLIITGKYVPDISSGERVFTRQALEKIGYKTLPHGLDTITAMTKRIVKRNLRYRTIPIRYPKRSGSSKLNIITDFLRMAMNIIIQK